MQKVSYDTKLLPPGSPLTPLKKVLKVIVPSFFMLFFKKKEGRGSVDLFRFQWNEHVKQQDYLQQSRV